MKRQKRHRQSGPVRRRITWFLPVMLLLLFLTGIPVFAAEEESGEVAGLDSLELDELEEYLSSALKEEEVSFSDLVRAAVSGDFTDLLALAASQIANILFGALRENGSNLRKMLALTVFSSLYISFAGSFVASRGPGRIGFLVAYLMMAALALTAFQAAYQVAAQVLTRILTFMGMLLPVFFLTVAYAGGTVTATSFYELMLIVMAAVEWILTNLLLPLTEVYLILRLVNSLSEEDFLSRLADLIRRLIEWGMKTTVGVVVGMNLIQTMTLPLVDSVKNQTIRKLVSAIPWLGRGTDILTNVVLGTGALLKNGVGAAGMVVLVLLCLTPLVQLALLVLLYQGAAALVQPLADPRLLTCLTETGEGCRLLMNLVLYTLVLFLLSLGILCAASNLNYTAG
ncbi:MAG: stage III sporulation protein AE [Lachnospiraceae bacterium]|nr:stage III sporulation protein AE [Lachnospiraceae bacterium]